MIDKDKFIRFISRLFKESQSLYDETYDIHVGGITYAYEFILNEIKSGKFDITEPKSD